MTHNMGLFETIRQSCIRQSSQMPEWPVPLGARGRQSRRYPKLGTQSRKEIPFEKGFLLIQLHRHISLLLNRIPSRASLPISPSLPLPISLPLCLAPSFSPFPDSTVIGDWYFTGRHTEYNPPLPPPSSTRLRFPMPVRDQPPPQFIIPASCQKQQPYSTPFLSTVV